MSKGKDNNTSYEKLRLALKNGEVGKCYVFHGPEQYLLRSSLSKLRALLCPDGLDSFNYKHFDAGNITAELFEEAVEAFPLFGTRNLVEIHDYQIFSKASRKASGDATEDTDGTDGAVKMKPDPAMHNDRERICMMLRDLPDHVCVVFIYTADEFITGDKRLKTTKAVLENIEVVEFGIQNVNELVPWIIRHFRSAGKEISTADARYLAEITDGLMFTLNYEIEKAAAYAKGQCVQRSDIDAVVIPVIDAVIYRLTDAIVRQDNRAAMQILDKLFQMHEIPHKLLYSISAKIRQLLAARVCIDCNFGKAKFIEMCAIPKNLEFTADLILNTARKTTLTYCRRAVLMCSQTAKEINSTGGDSEARIVELVAKLALASINNV